MNRYKPKIKTNFVIILSTFTLSSSSFHLIRCTASSYLNFRLAFQIVNSSPNSLIKSPTINQCYIEQQQNVILLPLSYQMK